jgi:hypothetical protein
VPVTHAARVRRREPPSRPGSAWWAPRRAYWWIAVLFSIGSTCFLVGPFPGFINLVGAGADGAVFFAGSIFFTSAALLQFLETANAHRAGRLRLFTLEPDNPDWWATLTQLVGTLFFNLSTFHALQTGLSSSAQDRLIWAPDALGSTLFLISGVLAWVQQRAAPGESPRSFEGWIAAVNLGGCIAFGLSAIGSFVVPKSGDLLALGAANFFTSLGALGFLIGAILLLPEAAAAEARQRSGG